MLPRTTSSSGRATKTRTQRPKTWTLSNPRTMKKSDQLGEREDLKNVIREERNRTPNCSIIKQATRAQIHATWKQEI